MINISIRIIQMGRKDCLLMICPSNDDVFLVFQGGISELSSTNTRSQTLFALESTLKVQCEDTLAEITDHYR